MPRKKRPGEAEAAPEKPKAEASKGKPSDESPKERVKTREEEFEERPDIRFARQFDKELSFAYHWESALEMESDLERELEQELVEEGDAGPWEAQIIGQSWRADPAPKTIEDFQRFRMPPDAYKAMQIADPLEAMLLAQASALHTNSLHMLGQATRLKDVHQKPELAARCYTSATKLSGAFAKLVETLKRYRTKGEQKVSVRYERLDRATQRTSKLSHSKRERITVSGSGVEVGDLDGRNEKEPEEIKVAGEDRGKK